MFAIRMEGREGDWGESGGEKASPDRDRSRVAPRDRSREILVDRSRVVPRDRSRVDWGLDISPSLET